MLFRDKEVLQQRFTIIIGQKPRKEGLNLDIERLKYFISVAHTLNFSEAARRNGLTQAAISYHINELEKELNCKLFIRSKRNVIITPSGADVSALCAGDGGAGGEGPLTVCASRRRERAAIFPSRGCAA